MLTTIDSLPAFATGEPLGKGVVDLWWFRYQSVTDPRLLAAYYALMTEEERSRYHKFVFERDRQMFLATRALVRTVLSHYAEVAPAEWRFTATKYGKPYVSGPRPIAHVEFNLTNTRGLVACAVSCSGAIGVDAEWIERPGETVSIARDYFSSSEVRDLRALDPDAQRDRFFTYWTLKESYIKARGLGVSLPLKQFSFIFDDGGSISIAFDAAIADDPCNWRFASMRGSPAHLVAVSAHTGGYPLRLRGREYIPLLRTSPLESNL